MGTNLKLFGNVKEASFFRLRLTIKGIEIVLESLMYF